MEKLKIHKKIYLQVWGDGDPEFDDPVDPDEMYWCQDKVNDHDVAYVLEEEAVLDRMKAHKKGFKNGWEAAGKAIAKELKKISGPLLRAVEKRK